VRQDDRGTAASGGNFTMFRSGADDGIVTLDWITQQPWSNGEVYTVGISADGMGEIALILNKPQMIKGQWWSWTTGNGHHFVYPQGMYRQDLLEGYMHALNPLTHGVSTNDIIPAVRSHETWSEWWYNITDCRMSTSALPCHYSSVKWPVVSTAAWWDLFSQVQLDDFDGIRKYSDPAVRDQHVLIVAPLGHCILSPEEVISRTELDVAEATSLVLSGRLAGEFFKGNMNGTIRSRIGRLNFYVMSHYDALIRRNWWTSLKEWPAFASRIFYLQGAKTLGPAPAESGSIEYEYDPAQPAPMLGGGNIPFVSSTKGCATADQMEREKRSDVVVFDSEVLTEHMHVVGRLSAQLYVSSSRNDTDFVVTVSDLSPKRLGNAQKSMLVRYGGIRMRWRSGDEGQSDFMSPERVYKVDIDLATIAYVFAKGHRVRLAVSSAAAPFYNPNYNTGKSEVVDKNQQPLKATNSIYFSTKYPSSVSIPVVNRDDIPPNDLFRVGSAEENFKFEAMV